MSRSVFSFGTYSVILASMTAADSGGPRVLIVSTGSEFFAYQADCPHEAIALEQGIHDGSVLTCLEHLWQFDVRTGAPLGDAEKGLSGYRLKEEDGALHVWIDDEDAGSVTLPEALQHMGRMGAGRSGFPYGGAPAARASILVSRSLNFDDVTRAFKSGSDAYSASMATGAPDSGGRVGLAPTAWSPDPARPAPHWIDEYREALKGRVQSIPKRVDLVQIQLNEQLIVELYSK